MAQKELPGKKKRILLSDTPLRPRASDDQESVGAVGPDQFKLADRMSRLVEAILSPDTSTPFTVAITGDWGTGKTSSMGFLDEHIRYISSRSTCQTKFETCWIKPWKYQDREQVLKGLLYELIAATKPDPSVLKQVGAVILGTAAGGLSLISAKAIEKDKSEGSVSGKATGAVAEGRAVFDAINNPEARFSNVFEDAFKKLVTSKFKGNKRLIIFIDDLDRCLPEVALQVLEAIKLYLDIPNIVFVIGVDRAIIDGIVIKHYCEALKPTEEERSAVVSKARSYLDKMFQVEFQAPPHEYEVRRFLASQFEELDLWNELKQEYKESFEPAIGEVGQINPRAIVRAINTAVIGSGETLNEIQTIRKSGNEVPESLGLKLAQSVQMELIKAITSRLDERDFFPGVSEICRRELGVSFLKSWSNACFNNPGKARYLVDQQEVVPDRNPKFDVYVGSPRKRATGLTGQSESTPVDESHLKEIEEAWMEFRSLMRHRAVGLCMGVPWPIESPNDGGDGGGASDSPSPSAAFDLLIARIADQRRTVPSQIDVEELKKETILNLNNNWKVDDEVLIGVSQLTNLTTLVLTDTSITADGLKSLEKLPNLTTLYLSYTSITDDVLKSLTKLTGLKHLILSGDKTEEGLKRIRKALPNCKLF